RALLAVPRRAAGRVAGRTPALPWRNAAMSGWHAAARWGRRWRRWRRSSVVAAGRRRRRWWWAGAVPARRWHRRVVVARRRGRWRGAVVVGWSVVDVATVARVP